MMSTERATLAVKILGLILAAALSLFWLTNAVPKSAFVLESVESVEDSEDTVQRFSAATLAASLAITALPDDFATPLAENLADMNIYFIVILMALFLESIIILWGIRAAFQFMIPLACALGILSVVLKRDGLKSLAIRLAVLALAVALVIPCSTHLTNYVTAGLQDHVEATIAATEDGANKLTEASAEGGDEKTLFEKMSELFQTAITGVTDLLTHFRNSIRQCMTSIAILLLTNCLIPILNFLILRWVLKETFHIVIPALQLKRRSGSDPSGSGSPGCELTVAGE